MSLVTALGQRITTAVALRTTNKIPVPATSRANVNLFSLARDTGNMESQMRALEQVGILFAIIDKLATGVASAHWRLYHKAASGRADDRTEIFQHPALFVLNNPNPFYTLQELMEASQQHQDLTGETWWIIARNERSSLPLELWPVRPDRMAPVTSPTEFISGYSYMTPDGGTVPLRIEDVIFIRRPNPLDPFRGLGPIRPILTYIDGERYAAEWNRNFFLNGAVPGGLIEVEKRLSDPEFDKMSERWQQQHKGVANAHRVAILEQARWVDVKYTQRDMQFVELSNISDDKIRRSFGFPKPMLGDTEDSNRAVAQAAEYVFARWLIVPRLERFKSALNHDLLPLFGGSDGLEFDYDSPVPEDAEAENAERDSKVKAVTDLINAGFDPGPVLEWAEMPNLPFSKPAPPLPSPGPPPGGQGESGGAGLVPSESDDAQAEAVYRLGMFIMGAPEGPERDRRIEALRALAGAADATRIQELPW